MGVVEGAAGAITKIRERADLGRRVAFLTDFYALPAAAQQALYGIAGELEQAADALVADREALLAERDTLQAQIDAECRDNQRWEDSLAVRVGVLEGALRDRERLFDCLRTWTLHHLDALDEDLLEADENGVLNSLRMILDGHPGCTEREDYTDAQWDVLQASRALAAGEALPDPRATAEAWQARAEKAEARVGVLEGALRDAMDLIDGEPRHTGAGDPCPTCDEIVRLGAVLAGGEAVGQGEEES